MAPSLREQLMDTVANRLQAITVANGYNTDAGTNAQYGRLKEPNPREVPLIVYWDGQETLAPKWGPNSRAVTLTVELYEKSLEAPLPETANQLLADIDKALYRDAVSQQVEVTFGGLVQRIQFSRSTLVIAPLGIQLAGVLSEYELIYRQILGDPYAA